MVGELRRMGSLFPEGPGFDHASDQATDDHARRTTVAQCKFHSHGAVGNGLSGRHLAPEARAVRTQLREPLFQLLHGSWLKQVLHGVEKSYGEHRFEEDDSNYSRSRSFRSAYPMNAEAFAGPQAASLRMTRLGPPGWMAHPSMCLLFVVDQCDRHRPSVGICAGGSHGHGLAIGRDDDPAMRVILSGAFLRIPGECVGVSLFD